MVRVFVDNVFCFDWLVILLDFSYLCIVRHTIHNSNLSMNEKFYPLRFTTPIGYLGMKMLRAGSESME